MSDQSNFCGAKSIDLRTLDKKDFERKRKRLQNSVIPSSIFHVASANGMLIIGIGRSDGIKACDFPIPEYLIFAGAISLGLIVFGAIAHYIIEFLLMDKRITRYEAFTLKVMAAFAKCLEFVQLIIIAAGAIVVLPHWIDWQHDDLDKPNYCEYGVMMFSTIFLTFNLICLVFAGLAYIYIKSEKCN